MQIDSTEEKEVEQVKWVMARSDIGMTYIRPCITDAGKISAETHLVPGVEDRESSFGFLDSSRLCWLLNLSEVFSSVKCSQNLGIAKMDHNGKTIVVSKAGRINIRTAESKEDALKTTWLVSRVIWPAMICSKCHRAILECVSGACGKCNFSTCPLLIAGPPNPMNASSGKRNTKTVSEILSELKTSQPSILNAINDILQSVIGIFNEALSNLPPGHDPNDIEAVVKGKLEEANHLAQRLIVQNQRQIEMSAGLALLGIVSNLGILSEALSSLVRFDLSNSERLALKRSWGAMLGQYERMWKCDPAQHQKRKRIHSSYSRKNSTRDSGANIDLRKNLETVTDMSDRFLRIAKISLAA